MSKLKEKFEEKGRLLKLLREAVNAEEFEQEKVDKINKDINTLDEDIRAFETAQKLHVDNEKMQEPEKKQEPEKPDVKAVLDKFIRSGEMGNVEGRNKRTIELRANQFYKGTDNKGGYLVPDEIGNIIANAQAFIGGMVTPGLATWIRTATGRKIEFPTVDDTSTKATVIAEKTDLTAGTDVTFGVASLDFYKVTTKFVKVSNELLQDSAFDVVAWLMDLLFQRMYRGLNNYFTVGTGSSQPYGVRAISAAGESAAKRSITRTDIVNLIYSVDRAYRDKAVFMMNDSTVNAIRALYVGSGDARPLWQDAMVAGEPARLEGYPVIVNNEVDDIAPYHSSVYFGDFSKFYIGEALPMKIVRVDELYAGTDEVGFNVLGRYAGNLVAADNPIKHIRHALT